MREYFSGLIEAFGRGWNRFFYTPTDPFPLCLLRVIVALIAIYWQLTFTPDLARFLGADGIFPLASVERLSPEGFSRWTMFAFFDDANGIWIAHALATVVLLALAIGIKTRIAAPLALYVALSYIHRAPMVTGLPERVLAFLLFYLCFAPSGVALSIDAILARRRGNPVATDPPQSKSAAANVVLRLIQIHLVVVYAMMGLAKLGIGSDTWWMGEAVWWLAARPETRLIDLTGLLHDHPLLINAWSHAVVLFEISFAIFIWNRWTRPLLLMLSVPMYLALALLSGQALFCLLVVVAGIVFVPAETLRNLFARPVATEPGKV